MCGQFRTTFQHISLVILNLTGPQLIVFDIFVSQENEIQSSFELVTKLLESNKLVDF